MSDSTYGDTVVPPADRTYCYLCRPGNNPSAIVCMPLLPAVTCQYTPVPLARGVYPDSLTLDHLTEYRCTVDARPPVETTLGMRTPTHLRFGT